MHDAGGLDDGVGHHDGSEKEQNPLSKSKSKIGADIVSPSKREPVLAPPADPLRTPTNMQSKIHETIR